MSNKPALFWPHTRALAWYQCEVVVVVPDFSSTLMWLAAGLADFGGGVVSTPGTRQTSRISMDCRSSIFGTSEPFTGWPLWISWIESGTTFSIWAYVSISFSHCICLKLRFTHIVLMWESHGTNEFLTSRILNLCFLLPSIEVTPRTITPGSIITPFEFMRTIWKQQRLRKCTLFHGWVADSWHSIKPIHISITYTV